MIQPDTSLTFSYSTVTEPDMLSSGIGSPHFAIQVAAVMVDVISAVGPGSPAPPIGWPEIDEPP